MIRPTIDLGDKPGEYKSRMGVGYAGRYGPKKSKRPKAQFFKAEKTTAAVSQDVAIANAEALKKMVGIA